MVTVSNIALDKKIKRSVGSHSTEKFFAAFSNSHNLEVVQNGSWSLKTDMNMESLTKIIFMWCFTDLPYTASRKTSTFTFLHW